MSLRDPNAKCPGDAEQQRSTGLGIKGCLTLGKRIAIVSALLCVIAPASALAHRVVRPDPATTALVIAYHYWHTIPCSGHVTIESQSPPFVNMGPVPSYTQVSMFSSWDSNLGYNEEAGVLPFSGCKVVINRAVWRSAYFEAYTAWPEFSVDIIHEVGHLLGLPDLFADANAGSVMYVEPNPLPHVTGETLWR